MLSLHSELLEHLSAGGTLLVPTRQRAAAVRLAYGAAMLCEERRVWSTPDVLPWGAWIERELLARRAAGADLPRRLSPAESRWLWGEAVGEACSHFDVLLPGPLLQDVQRALELLDDYGLVLPSAGTPETALLLAVRSQFDAHCARLQVLGRSSWRNLSAPARTSRSLLLAGFGSPGPARRRWLEGLGARFAGTMAQRGAGAPADGRVQARACADPSAEAEAAAQWCVRRLAEDPTARLLIVVPRLAERRTLWQRALSWQLGGADWLEGNAPEPGLFAIEGGVPLSQYPLIQAVLQLLGLAAWRELRFPELSATLRAPFFPALDRCGRLELDLWLREQALEFTHGSTLERLSGTLTAGSIGSSGPPAAAQIAWRGLLEALRPVIEGPAARSAAEWARAYAQTLARCGWDVPMSLDSATQQVRVRFDELLGDFAAIGIPGSLARTEALELLQQLAAGTAFEPASDDVPVTVTANLEDPIVRYDGIWVAGLSADVWPPPPRPDPLIPLGLQRAAGVAQSSPALAVTRAREVLAGWVRAAEHCVLSWPRRDGDLSCDPSPMLREWISAAAPNTDVADVADAADPPLDALLGRQAPVLEHWRDEAGPAWSAGASLGGGTRLLELQSLCPFRSFAQLRLGARRLEEPEPGIGARQRGRLLHRALELFWSIVRDSNALRAYGLEGALGIARAPIAQALGESLGAAGGSCAPALRRQEQTRCEQLFARLIEWELSRPPFRTQALEWPQVQPIGAAAVTVRLDRVDRLEDGRLVVIDYKTGAPQPFDAEAERPRQPQLPLYALAAGASVAAVAAVHLQRDRVSLRGVGDRADRLPGLPGLAPADEWQPLQRRWAGRLQRLVGEFLAGEARVDPQPGACQYCGLQPFCRVRVEVGPNAEGAATTPADDAEDPA